MSKNHGQNTYPYINILKNDQIDQKSRVILIFKAILWCKPDYHQNILYHRLGIFS